MDMKDCPNKSCTYQYPRRKKTPKCLDCSAWLGDLFNLLLVPRDNGNKQKVRNCLQIYIRNLLKNELDQNEIAINFRYKLFLILGLKNTLYDREVLFSP